MSLQEFWAIARFDLKLSDREFLEIAPVSLDALMKRAAVADRKALFPGALVSATICNVKNDWEKNPDGWTPADFLPGAKREDDTERFIREMEKGQVPQPDPQEMAAFKMKLQKDLNLKPRRNG